MRMAMRAALLSLALGQGAHAAERISMPDDTRRVEASATTDEGSKRRVAADHDTGGSVGKRPVPYTGYWAADHRACRNPDSDERMAIEAGAIDWYETHCTIGRRASLGRAWVLDLACRGEGQRMHARARVWLPTADTLVVENGPIGPARRQHYIRCRPH